MNRIQLACCCLMASAFVLAGLLAANLAAGGRGVEPSARADMVIARDDFGLMTAQTRTNGESLFVLDNSQGRLLIYNYDVPSGQFQVAGNADLDRLFTQAGAGGPTQGGPGTGRPGAGGVGGGGAVPR